MPQPKRDAVHYRKLIAYLAQSPVRWESPDVADALGLTDPELADEIDKQAELGSRAILRELQAQGRNLA